MTDAELRDAAWAELTQTTVGWNRVKGYPPAKLAGTHWGKAKEYLDMIGRNRLSPPAAPLGSGGGSSPSGPLHTHRVTVDTGATDGGGNNYGFVYPRRSSDTTQDPSGEYGTIGWAPGDLYESGMVVWVLVSFKPVVGRTPGRIVNFHNNPQRGGWLDPPHVASGVSATAIDWFGDQTVPDGPGGSAIGGLRLYLEGNGAFGQKAWQVMSIAEMDAAIAGGTWVDLVIKVNIATDGTGNVKIWAQGESSPRVNTGGCRTAWQLNNGLGPQTGYALWTGMYNSSGMSVEHTYDFVVTRVGRTLDEALADGIDTPITEPVIYGSTYRLLPTPDDGSGAAAYTHTAITSRDASDFQIGTGLS